MTDAPQTPSRTLGWLYLAVTVLGPFALMVVPQAVIVQGASGPQPALAAHEELFRLGIAADLGLMLLEFAIPVLLHQALRHLGPSLSLVALVARASMAALMGANAFLSVGALQLSADPLLEGAVRDRLVLALLETHVMAGHLWEVCFALHLALVAVLLWRHRSVPRAFGPLVGLAAVGYAVSGFGAVLLPSHAGSIAAFVAVTAILGEVPFMVWLLVKGTPASSELRDA